MSLPSKRIMSKDLIDHEREEKGEISDYQNMINAPQRIHARFSEAKHRPIQTHYLVDDKVVVYWEFTANTRKLDSLAPTIKPVRMKGVDIFQISAGKIKEIWHVEALHQIQIAIAGDS